MKTNEQLLQENNSRYQRIENLITYMFVAVFAIALGSLGYILYQWFGCEASNPNFPQIYVGIYCGMSILFFGGMIIYYSAKRKMERLEAEKRLILETIYA